MDVNQKLLLGSSIDDPDMDGLRHDLCEYRLPDTYCVIVYTVSASLEIYSTRMIHYNPGVLRPKDLIVGLAASKEEAYSLILEVMDQIYALGKYQNLPQFMEEQLGVMS